MSSTFLMTALTSALALVVQGLQREVVLCNLFQHVADAALCLGGGGDEHEANGD